MAQTYIDSRGYRRFFDSGNAVHRWVAEKKLGRSLRKGEVVHHIDRDKLNNHLVNLYICKNQWHHFHLHKIDASKYGWKYSFGC